ncbi:MAG: DUF502 domain-containing protein [Chlamydiae bacterium]|jgi:uncharacterized membrane protein|nr:DUF502 domain-containing protein [Chlamydiota bacterium]
MKKYFITGLVILLPLAMTVAIVAFIVNFLTQPFMGLVTRFLSEFNIANHGFLILSPEQTLKYGSQLLILVSLMVITVFLGMIARWFFFKSLINFSDKLLHKIPVVNKVYKTSQEIIKTLFSSDKNSFKTVVMVPFPNESSYAIGLIARESPKECSRICNEELISVLIPTTPNPTTGYLLMYRKSQIIELKMKPEEAIKYIVSCGVIIPHEE